MSPNPMSYLIRKRCWYVKGTHDGRYNSFFPNSDFENGFGRNSAFVLQFILNIVADILPSQYASYRVLDPQVPY